MCVIETNGMLMESALRKIGTPEALAALALAEGVRNG